LYCPACGTVVGDEDKFCKKCGKTLSQSDLTDDLTQKAVTTSKSGMHCPKCGQIDMVQSVPAIVKSGSSTFNYEVPVGFVYKGTGGTFMVNKEGRAKSDLTQLLESFIPKEPINMDKKEKNQFALDCEQFYGHKIEMPQEETGWGCLVILGLIGVLLISMSIFEPYHKQYTAGTLGFGLLLLALPFIYKGFKSLRNEEILKKYKEQCKQYYQLRKDFIAYMYKRWWESFYCARCNVVYIPDKSGYKSMDDMKRFLMEKD